MTGTQPRTPDFAMSNKIYPVDVLSINAKQPLQEVIFGLKNLLLSLRGVCQKGTDEEKNYDELVVLFHHLRNPDFLSHEDSLVKMTVACCLGQLLEVLPFTSFPWNDEDLVVLLNFFTKQLEYFGTSDDVIFKYCVILLKILSKTGLFSGLFMCLKYTTNKENIYDAFLLTVCMAVCTRSDISMAETYIVQLLKNFINNTKYTSNKGIDIILSSILQENIEKHPAMYHVAVKVIRNCSRALDFPVRMLLLRGLQEDGIPVQTRIGGHEFEVMFELHHICPSLLVGVWSQLEVFLLDSLDSSKKKIALTLLAHMFSEEDSDFAFKYRRLWNSFKLCVNDSSSFGRSLIVSCAPKFLINQPDLCQDIIPILERRSCDSETTIRFGVVKAINKATKMDLNVLQHPALFDILKKSFCDKNEIVLKEALVTLGLIYRRITDSKYPSMMRKAMWIANTLMHLYMSPYDLNIYIPHIEKVVVKCLVPCELPPEKRMKKLLQLWCLLDDESRSSFHHIQELKKRAYEAVLRLLSLYQGPSDVESATNQLVWKREMLAGKISLTMGNQKEVHQRLVLLTKELAENQKLLNFLQEYVNETNSCEDYERLWSENQDIVSYTSQTKKRSLTSKRRVLKQESIVLTVKNLCAKVGSFLVDQVALKELLKLVVKCVSSRDIAEDLHLAGEMAGKLAIELLYEYFYVMPRLAFQDDSTMDQLLFLLRVQDCQYSLPALKIFVSLSAYKPLSEVFPAFVSHQLVPLWQQFATSGTPAQAKLAVRCLCSHITDPVIIYNILTEFMKELDTDSEHYLTREVAIGQFATHLPNYADTRCISYITDLCHKLCQKSVLEDLEDKNCDGPDWCEKDSLPYRTKCKVVALKALTRLTIRLREPRTTDRTLTILSKIVENGGAYSNTNSLSAATKAWLRLTAGCSFLKICDVPHVYAKQVKKIYFFEMATLMTDESEFVRRMFVEKLRQRLMQWEQQRYGLPSTFLSYFVLAGMEQDEDVKSCMLRTLNLCVQDKRQQVWSLICVTRLFKSTSHLLTRCQQAVPEFCVQTALQIVARFVFDFANETSVHQAYVCLSFLLNSLLSSKNGNFGLLATDFYVKLFALMRSCRNAVNPEDEELNKKIWATCEIGEYLLSTVNPAVNNDAEAPGPIIDEKFHILDPSIDKTDIKYLTSDIETLLNETVAPQLVGEFDEGEQEEEGDECSSDDEELAVFYPNSGEYDMQRQSISRPESPQVTFDGEASRRIRMRLQISRIQKSARNRRKGIRSSKKNQ